MQTLLTLAVAAQDVLLLKALALAQVQPHRATAKTVYRHLRADWALLLISHPLPQPLHVSVIPFPPLNLLYSPTIHTKSYHILGPFTEAGVPVTKV